jgi:group I intron endonuclease
MHKNKINFKVYVGQTSQNVKRRWKNGSNYKDCSYFYNAIQKYGWDNFEHIILKENLSHDEANYWEAYYINLYNSNNREFGYNLESGGCKNQRVSEYTKAKIRKAMLGENNPFYGKCHSEKSKAKMSEAHKNISEETRRKISESLKNRLKNPENNGMYGKSHSDEARRKMSETKLKKTMNGKIIYCIELNESFNRPKDAEIKYNVNSSSITSACKGKLKSAGKHPVTGEKLHWEYKLPIED